MAGTNTITNTNTNANTNKLVANESLLTQIVYSTGFNVLNLLACLVGAGLFGKISLLILLALSSCIFAVFASFFLDTEYQATYHNQNVTTMGFFKGISFNSLGGINQLLSQNWESTYSMDCSNPLAEVCNDFAVISFMKSVFASNFRSAYFLRF